MKNYTYLIKTIISVISVTYLIATSSIVHALPPQSLFNFPKTTITKNSAFISLQSLKQERITDTVLNRAKVEKRIIPIAMISSQMEESYSDINLSDKELALPHAKNIFLILPQDKDTLLPFLWLTDKDNFKVSCNRDKNIYLPLELLSYPQLLRLFINLELENISLKQLTSQKVEKASQRLFSIWSVDKKLHLMGRAKPYADTCKYLVNKHPDINFSNATDGVIDPVARSVWAKARIIDMLMGKGWSMINSNIPIKGTEQWVDCVFWNNLDQAKTTVMTHQGYFHEGPPFSEVIEGIWRLGAGNNDLAMNYIKRASRLIDKHTFSEKAEIIPLIKEAKLILTDTSQPISSRRKKASIRIKRCLDILQSNKTIRSELYLANRMLRKGWIDEIILKTRSGILKEGTNDGDKNWFFVDTRFDEVLKQLKENPGLLKELKTKNDPLAKKLVHAIENGQDIIWDMLKDRFNELKNEYQLDNIKINNINEFITIPKSMRDIRNELDSLTQTGQYRGHYRDIVEGVIYARYCGLLLELVATDYFLEKHYNILHTGIEIFNKKGIYITELDIVIEDPATGKLSLVEVKSMRRGMQKNKLLNTKVIYKLESYKTYRDIIEKTLGRKFDDVKFVIDVGHQTRLERFLHSKEVELSKKYDMPVEFISLDMGKLVERITTYTKAPSSKKSSSQITKKEKKQHPPTPKDAKLSLNESYLQGQINNKETHRKSAKANRRLINMLLQEQIQESKGALENYVHQIHSLKSAA